MRSWCFKTFCLSLLLAVGLAPVAWAEPASSGTGRNTPIIDIVTVVPNADHAAKLKAKETEKPLDLKAARLLGSSGNLDTDRRLVAASSGASSRDLLPNLIVGSGMGLDGRWERLGNWSGSSASMRPLGGAEARLDDLDPQGGFLAMKFSAGTRGDIMLGGGYSRHYSATSGGGSPSQIPQGALASVRSSESTSYDSMGRWNAFVAMPYQITQRVGVRPELSYYYGDNPSLGPEAGNEWVMGLRFTFGF